MIVETQSGCLRARQVQAHIPLEIARDLKVSQIANDSSICRDLNWSIVDQKYGRDQNPLQDIELQAIKTSTRVWQRTRISNMTEDSAG